MNLIYCACCGRPFKRSSPKGAAPRYCSDDCRKQMAVRRSAWAADWHTPEPTAVNENRHHRDDAVGRAGMMGDD